MIRTLICATTSLCAIVTALPEFDHVKTQRLAMSWSEETRLQRDCEAMNAEGKIRDLMIELNRSAQELENLNMEKIENRDAYRISRLRDEIHQTVESAERILRPEWTEDKWPFKAVWNIRFTDVLPIDARVIEANFGFLDFELENLGLAGVEREDLYPFISVKQPSSQSIRVEIEKRASSLELCQLQPTWVIGGTVRYKFLMKNYVARSELTLRPGVTRPPAPLLPRTTWPITDPIKPYIPCEFSHSCPKIRPPFGPNPKAPLKGTYQ